MRREWIWDRSEAVSPTRSLPVITEAIHRAQHLGSDVRTSDSDTSDHFLRQWPPPSEGSGTASFISIPTWSLEFLGFSCHSRVSLVFLVLLVFLALSPPLQWRAPLQELLLVFLLLGCPLSANPTISHLRFRLPSFRPAQDESKMRLR